MCRAIAGGAGGGGAGCTAGYFVSLTKPGQPKPYQAQVTRGGKSVSLGCFATAEEAALCGAQALQVAAAAAPLTSEDRRRGSRRRRKG